MKNLSEIVEYAKSKGMTKDSRILNVTHFDLDGVVSVINLLNFFKKENVFYVQKSYHNVNEFFRDVLFKGNCSFRNPDFVIISDLSVEEEVVQECKDHGIELLILDHHQTAYDLNKYVNCHVDDTESKSGAEVVIDFLKEMGMESPYMEALDKLNYYATMFDLHLCATPEHRKFDIEGVKKSIPEMLNILFFKDWDKDDFIAKWLKGWRMFTKEELGVIKDDQRQANAHLKHVQETGNVVPLAEDKVMVLTEKHVVSISDHYIDNKGMNLVLIYNPQKQKMSGRVHENSKINIGKIFELLHEKKDYVTNGGGHEKAGGTSITANSHLQEFVKAIVTLAEYYERNK